MARRAARLAGLTIAVTPIASPAQVASLETQAPPAPANGNPAPPVEITGPDGEPLPAELRQRIEADLRENPLPVPAPTPSEANGAQTSATPGEVVVTGQRPRGSVVGNIPPQRTLTPLDLRAYGTNDIGELLQAIAPQVSSIQGRDANGPVVLLNGKRVSSFAEIEKIPTEAIERMEVFPEELALKYGYRADQKVVNVVAYERFSSRLARVSYLVPTEGGRDTPGINANFLRIWGDTRVNVDADYARSGYLLESERDVVQLAGSADAGRSRSLLPASQRLVLNGTVSGTVIDGVSSTLNGRLEATDLRSLLGPGSDGPLRRDLDTRTAHLGTTSNGAIGSWLWTFTGNYDRIATDTDTDRPGDAAIGRDAARAVNALANADLLISGSPLQLPAGPLSTSLRVGGETRDFTGRSRRDAAELRTDLARDRASVQANLDLPIASRRKPGLDWLGDLSVNANGAIQRLSDAGTLRTLGYGVNWSPIATVNVIASLTDEEGAPTVEQLGAPIVVTPNARVFDFTRGEVVDVTRVFGGNPTLRADDRRVIKLGANVRPWASTDLNVSVDFIDTRIDDPIAPFPIATAAIEAAFPERFTRDAGGRLIRIDGSPLNFERADQQQLRWGINFTRPLGPVPRTMQNANVRFVSSEADLQRSLPPGARVIMPPPGSAAAKNFENLSSRLTLSLYHTWRLEDEIVVRRGVPVLDLLDGSAIDGRGGRARHGLELQAGAFKRGLGARLTVNWQSGTGIDGVADGSGDPDRLRFADYTVVNIDVFANLAERFGGASAHGWAKGTRVSLSVVNAFNKRLRVTDDTGATPISFQPAYLDPLGRLVNLTIRKVF